MNVENKDRPMDWRNILLAVNDAKALAFNAQVLAICKASRSVLLDQTYFYPKLSAQPADQGVMEWKIHDVLFSSVISGAFVKDKNIWHRCSGSEILPNVGDSVSLTINKERRDFFSRCHSAVVLIAGLAHRAWSEPNFKCQVGSCRISEENMHLDFTIRQKGNQKSKEDFYMIVDKANEIISSPNTKIETRWIESVELQDNKEKYRSGATIARIGNRAARIVKIFTIDETYEEQFDLGTHVTNIREIGIIIPGDENGNRFRKDKGKDIMRMRFHLNPVLED